MTKFRDSSPYIYSRWRCMRLELNHWFVSFVVLLLERVV